MFLCIKLSLFSCFSAITARFISFFVTFSGFAEMPGKYVVCPSLQFGWYKPPAIAWDINGYGPSLALPPLHTSSINIFPVHLPHLGQGKPRLFTITVVMPHSWRLAPSPWQYALVLAVLSAIPAYEAMFTLAPFLYWMQLMPRLKKSFVAISTAFSYVPAPEL